MEKDALCSWSGGKDSCFACMQALQQGYRPVVLLNVLNEEGKISRSHGIPAAVLEAQAKAAGLPIMTIASSWEMYETRFIAALRDLQQQYAVSAAIFGDIDLQPHRDWEEKVCGAVGLDAVLPLWQQSRRELVSRMLEAGIETVIVSCNTVMVSRFLGRQLSLSLVEELEELGIDPCGENGEFHTLVINCPLFSEAIQVSVQEPVLHNDYWFSKINLC